MLGYTIYDIHIATAPTTLNDFFLPGSQPGDSGSFENPSKCDNCHGGYDQEVEPDFFWKGSMMVRQLGIHYFSPQLLLPTRTLRKVEICVLGAIVRKDG